MDNKINVLYIAKNIPRPSTRTNKIIFVISENLSNFCKISILRPRERVPFWLKNSKKFGDLYGLKGWTYNNLSITTYPYIHLPFKVAKYWLLNRLSKIGRAFVDSRNFDLVHAHYLFPDGFIAYKIYKKYNTPYILTIRNQDKQYLENISPSNPDYRKAKKIIGSAQAILVTNLTYKQFIDNLFNVDCRIIPHGINPSVFQNESTKKQSRFDTINIAVVAAAISRKNIDWVINACVEYKGKQQISLHVIGDGPDLDKLKGLVSNQRNIKFHGRLPHQNAIELLGNSHIFALPSYNETFGMVYLEAAANHNAIIGYKGEGVWGVFENEKEMLFARNYEDFKQTLHTLINDTKKITELSKNAYKKAQTLKWDEVKKRYFEVYQEALNS